MEDLQVLDVNVIDVPGISRMAHYIRLLLTIFDVYYSLFLSLLFPLILPTMRFLRESLLYHY
jgi:hypothetical protein